MGRSSITENAKAHLRGQLAYLSSHVTASENEEHRRRQEGLDKDLDSTSGVDNAAGLGSAAGVGDDPIPAQRHAVAIEAQYLRLLRFDHLSRVFLDHGI